VPGWISREQSGPRGQSLETIEPTFRAKMTRAEPPAWAVEFQAALSRGDYLQALVVARNSADDAVPISYDLVAYVLQAIGRFAEADAVQERRAELERPKGFEALPAELQTVMRATAEHPIDTSAQPIPEVDTAHAPCVLAIAIQDRHVLILAEEHHHPEHRAFGARILPLQRRAGVTHLALEAGYQAPLDRARVEKRVRPDTDGFAYEPQRAALLRAALSLELPIVAFDMDSHDAEWLFQHLDEMIRLREQRMAEHIVERILEPAPAARVLVWVGQGHGQKVSRGLKTMAMHLWGLTGEEPFSAYQVSGDGSRPGVDLLIRHPEPKSEQGRPDWLRIERHSVNGVVTGVGECLVQLLLLSEGADSTPVDQCMTESCGQFELLAPDGEYLMRVWTAPGNLLDVRTISLAGPCSDLLIVPV
jgi:hypothetical protein